MKTEIVSSPFVSQSKSDVLLYKGEAYTYLYEGLSRMVFVNADKTKVIKHNKTETNFNQLEIDIYTGANEQDKAQMAQTTYNEAFQVIEQEYCRPMLPHEMTLELMLFANRCRGDVGWNSTGELVCFDFAEYKKY